MSKRLDTEEVKKILQRQKNVCLSILYNYNLQKVANHKKQKQYGKYCMRSVFSTSSFLVLYFWISAYFLFWQKCQNQVELLGRSASRCKIIFQNSFKNVTRFHNKKRLRGQIGWLISYKGGHRPSTQKNHYIYQDEPRSIRIGIKIESRIRIGIAIKAWPISNTDHVKNSFVR